MYPKARPPSGFFHEKPPCTLSVSARYSDSALIAARLQAADQQFPLVDHLRGQMIVQVDKELFVSHHFFVPCLPVDGLQFVEALLGIVEPSPIDIFIGGQPADRRFLGQGTAANAVYDPLQHANVIAESRPEKLPLAVLAEPVYVEDLRRYAQRTLHPDPVPEVVAHVIAAEW